MQNVHNSATTKHEDKLMQDGGFKMQDTRCK